MQTYDGDVFWKNGIKDSVFLSFSSADKEKALLFIQAMDRMSLNHFAMYRPDGSEANKSGFNHQNAGEEALKRTCVFVWLMSKVSMDSSEVLAEVRKAIESGINQFEGAEYVPWIFVSLDKGCDVRSLSNDLKKEFGFTSQMISSPFYDLAPSSSEAQLEVKKITKEIQQRYVLLRAKGLQHFVDSKNNARKFSNILIRSMSKKNIIKKIDDDIKECAEGNTSNLLEMHILTNELNTYDKNEFSCIAISNNLLGPCTFDKGYCPSEKGVKYFYYMTKENINEQYSGSKGFRTKIESFLRKDKFSRQTIIDAIKKRYYAMENLVDWTFRMSSMTLDAFIIQLGVDKQEDSEVFEFIENEIVGNAYTRVSHFDYSQKFSFPTAFLSWLKGEDCSAPTLRVVEKFILFVDRILFKMESSEQTKNTATPERRHLKVLLSHWRALYVLGKWQRGEIESWPYRLGERFIVKDGAFLLDELKGMPPFKNNEIAFDWLYYNEDDESAPYKTSDALVEAALANLYCIEVDENKMDLCYSFAFMMVEDGYPECTWYTCGTYEEKNLNPFLSDPNDMQTFVTSDVTGDPKEYKEAFKYLIKVNHREQELKEAGSQFYARYIDV